MNVEWRGERCLICLKQGPLTVEHLIPNSIGGTLTASFLCKDCNSYLGAKVESELRADPTIRLSTDHLRPINDSLASRIEEGLPFISHGESGSTKAIQKRGTVMIVPHKAEDGSLFQPVALARTSLINILRKAEATAVEVRSAIEKFEVAPLNEKVEIHPGLEIVTRQPSKVERDLSSAKLVEPLAMLKIAFEFMACHLGEAIYAEAWQFDEIRRALLGETAIPESCRITRLMASQFRPIHGLCNEGNNPHWSVQIRLLGLLVFRVEFLNISVGGPRAIYTHDLATGREVVTENAR